MPHPGAERRQQVKNERLGVVLESSSEKHIAGLSKQADVAAGWTF